MQLYPIRIIPVDICYKIDDKRKNEILNILSSYGDLVIDGFQLFGENAVLGINISEYLSFYLFADGVGIFVYKEQSKEYSNDKQLDAN